MVESSGVKSHSLERKIADEAVSRLVLTLFLVVSEDHWDRGREARCVSKTI